MIDESYNHFTISKLSKNTPGNTFGAGINWYLEAIPSSKMDGTSDSGLTCKE